MNRCDLVPRRVPVRRLCDATLRLSPRLGEAQHRQAGKANQVERVLP
ncbi:MAG: hypothetical protein FWE95_03395 [Planctomycetaceae bacterium]|nr:hypothetical protein [Planctomycetaceae bacterium]